MSSAINCARAEPGRSGENRQKGGGAGEVILRVKGILKKNPWGWYASLKQRLLGARARTRKAGERRSRPAYTIVPGQGAAVENITNHGSKQSGGWNIQEENCTPPGVRKCMTQDEKQEGFLKRQEGANQVRSTRGRVKKKTTSSR